MGKAEISVFSEAASSGHRIGDFVFCKISRKKSFHITIIRKSNRFMVRKRQEGVKERKTGNLKTGEEK